MSEEKYLDALSMYIDGELDADGEKELEDHIANSPNDAERLDEYRTISTLLKYPPDVPPELSKSVMERVRAVKRRRFRVRAATAAAAAAACIAVVIAVPKLMETRSTDSDSSYTVTESVTSSSDDGADYDTGTESTDAPVEAEADACLPEMASLESGEPDEYEEPELGKAAYSERHAAYEDEANDEAAYEPETEKSSGAESGDETDTMISGTSMFSDCYAVVYCESFPQEIEERDSFELSDGTKAALITMEELEILVDAGCEAVYFSDDSDEIIVIYE